MNRPGKSRLVLLLSVLALLASACTTEVAGTPLSQGSVVSRDTPGTGVDPKSFVKNTDGGEVDRLAATVVTDVRVFWTETFPTAFGKPFDDLSGGYYSVDTADADAKAPPCADKAADVEGNAFYCPNADIIAWDRAALLPVLRDRFGEAAVMLVLAHEMGHAVQDRTGAGLDERKADPRKWPTILIEAMADCYAGAFVRWVADGKAEHLEIETDRLDQALESLISFRDPIGTSQGDRGAHGDAFDRVSAFQDGYEQGVKLCSEMTVDNRTFTAGGFLSADDQARGGNLTFSEIFDSVTPGLDDYFTKLVADKGKQWTPPAATGADGEPTCDGGKQGPVAFCASTKALAYDKSGELPKIHSEIGDYATATLLASRYGLAARQTLGKPLDGEQAGRSAVCLSGSFTGSLFAANKRYLSPGDLDEAVQVLLDYDYAARDVKGTAKGAGFDRVREFRKGFTQGGDACGIT
ncbi:putative metalloprotease [Actinokineospora auranticolor]|uniref:Putative metalloprotease n=1 Tax=Actinokineospora auranticolor TaxID=155976 RepID=A0A2S6GCC5_9PSEU|nr:putative metalloprotease [Actinokineospora auranticolor]